MTIRVLLADDHDVIRAGLRVVAERDGDIEIVAEASDGDEAVEAARRHRPDVVLMDVRMPRTDGVAATRAIMADPANAAVRVVILTTFDEDEQVLAALRSGAAGYLLKDLSPEDLRAAIRLAARGTCLLAGDVTGTVLHAVTQRSQHRPALIRDLTDREIDVLREVARGRSNDEVGAALHLSPATARTYVSRLLAKLGVRDRSALVAIAYESGLVVPDQ